MAVSKERITVYNLADLKNTSDDAIPNYLNSLKFTQSHALTDVRLALGYSAFFLSAACFLWDYKLGFDSTKYFTAAAVAVYTLLNSALTLWIWLKEKGIVYEGTAPDGEKVRTISTQTLPNISSPTKKQADTNLSTTEQISIATRADKNTPIYHLSITLTPKSGAPRTLSLARSFTEWFDERGHFVATPFQTVLASNVPAVGRLDPKRAQISPASADDFIDATTTSEDLDALIAGSGSASAAAAPTAEATGSSAKKGGKRRKV